MRPPADAERGVAAGALACEECLARAWLLERLAGHLEVARAAALRLLALDDGGLIDAVAKGARREVRSELARLDPGRARARLAAAGVAAVCRCDPRYPARLRDLPAPPAVLHVATRAPAAASAGPSADVAGADPGADPIARLLALARGPSVAIVGARRASPYAVQVATELAHAAACAGATVISGLAAGVDAAAHDGALRAAPAAGVGLAAAASASAAGPGLMSAAPASTAAPAPAPASAAAPAATLAVLACAPERPYPASTRALHRRIAGAGAVVSELGPGLRPRRWMFPARNRIIAALADATVVVAGRPGSGALLTARLARELGRTLGAVPGPVGSPLSCAPHLLLREGAALIGAPADLLAQLGLEDRALNEGAPARARPAPPAPPSGPARRLLDALADGRGAAAAFAAAGLDAPSGLAALAELELAGLVLRGPGGSLTATALARR
ncbi:MAG TPA: DNA-processing protein DprA [Solirubrobacteraceae bacterium]|nr:DNA-processing protein DprA [Solirubrobacteraceae bacterium]